jgi:hypothetical protein
MSPNAEPPLFGARASSLPQARRGIASLSSLFGQPRWKPVFDWLFAATEVRARARIALSLILEYVPKVTNLQFNSSGEMLEAALRQFQAV